MLPSRASVYTVAGARYLLPKPDVLQREGPFVPADLPYMTVAMPDYQGNAGDDLRVDLVAEKLDGTLKREFSHRAAGAHPRLRDFLNALYAPFEGLRNTRVYYKVTGPATVRNPRVATSRSASRHPLWSHRVSRRRITIVISTPTRLAVSLPLRRAQSSGPATKSSSRTWAQ